MSFTLAHAQQVLLSNEMLPYGSVMTEKSIQDLTVLDTTIQGAGVVWNFSALTNNTADPDLLVNIVNPSSTPYASSFSNANYGYKEVTGASTNYRYFNLSSTKMERVGSFVSNVNVYNDPQVEYVFPFALGTVNNDTWDNTNSSTGGTYDLNCVGTGTLKIPSGNYNALMVRVHIVESFVDMYAYFWYSSDNGAILLSYIAGDGFFIGESGTYLGLLTMGVEESTFVTDVRYNNPVQNNFHLSFNTTRNEPCIYTVMNSMGQKIAEGNPDALSGSTHELSIDLSTYPAGIYFFSLRSDLYDQGTKTIKIIKN